MKNFNPLTTAVIMLISCGNPQKQNTTEMEQITLDSTVQKAVCPMHPDVIGKTGETCPKCGMKLELMKNEKAASAYFMDFKATPPVRAGEASRLSFRPSIKGKGMEAVALDLQHDKKIHLIIVSKDLSYFDHVHPELQADGSYEINVLENAQPLSNGKFEAETKFAQGGDYVLFADYMPTGAGHQVERIELNVPGNTGQVQKFTTQKLVSTVDDFEVSLVTEGDKFLSDGLSHMAAIVKKNGVEIPADQLEDFLAAKAHVVMISEDTKDYLHVHPDVVERRLRLHTTFGRTGIFRGWVQFKMNGEVHTTDFVLDVKEGMAPQHGEKKPHPH
jgi:hypothetical protein